MRIRVASGTGWNLKNKELVIKTCLEHNLLFLDTAAIADVEFCESGVAVVLYDPNNPFWGIGPTDYVYFEHRGRYLPSLVFDVTVAGDGYRERDFTFGELIQLQ